MMKKMFLTLVCTLCLASAVWAQKDLKYEIRTQKQTEAVFVQESSVTNTSQSQQALQVQERITPFSQMDGSRFIQHPAIPHVYTVVPIEGENIINAKKAPAVKAATDVSLVYVGHDNIWATVQKDHLPQTYNFYATVSNAGDNALTGVYLVVEVYTYEDVLVYSDSTPVPINLATGESAEIEGGSAFVLNQVNNYYVKYIARAAGDANEDNNVLYRWIEVSDDAMAPFTDNIPVSSANFLMVDGIVGMLITADKTDTLTAISYKTYSAAAATTAKASIYKVRKKYVPYTQELGYWNDDYTVWTQTGLDTVRWYDSIVSYELLAKSDDGIAFTYNMLNEYYLPIDRMASGSQSFRGVVLEKDSSYIVGSQGPNITIANTVHYNRGVVYTKAEEESGFSTPNLAATVAVRMHYGEIEPLGAIDAGVKALVTPKQTYALPSMLNVKADIKNYGSSEISSGSLTVYYQYENGSVKSKTVQDTVAPFKTLTVTFDDTVQLYRPETATFKVWTSIAGDINPNNDTLVSEIELVDPRYSWNFELPAWNFYSWNATASRNMFSPWRTVDGDYASVKSIFINNNYNVVFSSMSAQFGGGNVGNSGRRSFQGITPAMAAPTLATVAPPHSGKKIGWVASPAGQANDWLISPGVKLNGNSSVEFWAKAIDGGDNVEKMQVLVSTVDDTSQFVKVSGSEDVVIPKEWTKFSYDLNAYNDSNIYVAIRYVSNNQLFAVFDDILINTDFIDFIDFSVIAVSSPNIISDSTIDVTFQNLGSISLGTSVSLSYKINDAAPVTAVYNVHPIESGAVRDFTFPEKITFPVGHHTIKVWVNYDLDDNHANDTFVYIVDINPLADTFHITFEEMVDFSENYYPWTNLDGDKSLSYNIGSINEPLSYTKEWQRLGFITFNPESTIPASTSRYKAKEGVKFGASIGVWDPTKQSNDWLISPPIVPNGDFNYIKLWVKSSSSTLEKYRVLVSTTDNSPASFVSLTPDTLEAPDSWTEIAYSLNDYIGQQIYVAIQCVSWDGHVFMIDDISIVTGESALSKASVTDALAPSSYPKLPFDEAEVSVSIANVGNQSVKPATVSYQLDGGAVITEAYSGDNIAWRESAVYTFAAKTNIEAAGIHVFKAWVDGFDATDTLTQNIYINGPQNSTFLDFEDAYDFTSVLLPWENIDADNLSTITFNLILEGGKSYELGYPGAGKPQSFLVFNPAQTSVVSLPNYISPVSGDRIAISVRPNVTNTSSSDWLISPKISLLQGTSKVSFQAKGLSSSATEKIRVLVSTSGTNPEDFTVVPSADMINVKSSSWTEYSCNISNYANQDVYVAIQCVSEAATGAILMIDDVEIYTSEENAIEENVRANAVRITPNPAQDVIKISSVTPIKEVFVYNVSGKEVMRSAANTLRVASLPAGMYVVKALLSNGTVSISKLIKK